MPPPPHQDADLQATQVIDLTEDEADTKVSTRTTSKLPSNQAKLDITAAIALWKTNPELYIQQEREKTLIRRTTEQTLATFERSYTPVIIATFKNFQKLPNEIRRMIWKLVARAERVVEILLDTWTEKDARNARLLSDTYVPAILHVHRESRDIGLKVYEKVTVCRSRKGVKVFGITYINWDADAIMFTNVESLENFLTRQRDPGCTKSTVLEACTKLAVPHQQFDAFRLGVVGDLQFKKVEELIIVYEGNRFENSNAGLTLDPPPAWNFRLEKVTRLNEFKAIMKDHSPLKSAVVKMGRRSDKLREVDPKEMYNTPNKQKALDRQYDADLLAAARLQEELDRRG